MRDTRGPLAPDFLSFPSFFPIMAGASECFYFSEILIVGIVDAFFSLFVGSYIGFAVMRYRFSLRENNPAVVRAQDLAPVDLPDRPNPALGAWSSSSD